MVRFEKRESAAGQTLFGQRRLMAFIVRPDRHIEMVDLGPSDRIAQAVRLWRVANFADKLKDDQKPQIEKLAADWRSFYGPAAAPSEKLRQWVWEPLSTHLNGCKTIVVAPDGALAYFPWPAFPGKEAGSYLLEEVAVAVLPVPQLLPDLVNKAPPADNADFAPGMLLVGDVHMTGDPGTPKQSSQAATAKKIGRAAAVTRRRTAQPRGNRLDSRRVYPSLSPRICQTAYRGSAD